MMQQRLDQQPSQRQLDLQGWFRVGRKDFLTYHPFNPPSGAGASYYLAGWMEGEKEMIKKFFIKQ